MVWLDSKFIRNNASTLTIVNPTNSTYWNNSQLNIPRDFFREAYVTKSAFQINGRRQRRVRELERCSTRRIVASWSKGKSI